MKINLPQIQYFYGNTDFNNWIRRCKHFVPTSKPKINPIHDFFNQIMLTSKFYEKVPIIEEKQPLLNLTKTTHSFDGGFSERRIGSARDIYNFLNKDMKPLKINTDVLNELLHYANDKSLEIKVKRIYSKCIKVGKNRLARRIKRKYPRFFVDDDWFVAMSWAFNVLNQNRKK